MNGLDPVWAVHVDDHGGAGRLLDPPAVAGGEGVLHLRHRQNYADGGLGEVLVGLRECRQEVVDGPDLHDADGVGLEDLPGGLGRGGLLREAAGRSGAGTGLKDAGFGGCEGARDPFGAREGRAARGRLAAPGYRRGTVGHQGCFVVEGLPGERSVSDVEAVRVAPKLGVRGHPDVGRARGAALGQPPGASLALLVGGAPHGDKHRPHRSLESHLAEVLERRQAAEDLVDLAVGVMGQIGFVEVHGGPVRGPPASRRSGLADRVEGKRGAAWVQRTCVRY